MHGLVINICADTLGNIETIALSLTCLPKMLLFIADVVLCACNDSGILNAPDSGIDQGASQIRVRTEPFLQALSETRKKISL